MSIITIITVIIVVTIIIRIIIYIHMHIGIDIDIDMEGLGNLGNCCRKNAIATWKSLQLSIVTNGAAT